MTQKLSRRDAAKLLKFSPIILMRLHILTTNDMESPRDYDAWCAAEYTEQDNILFRLLVELKKLLTDSGALFTVLREIWEDIDCLVDTTHADSMVRPGVVVVADGRYVRWPGRQHWLDLWEPDRQRVDQQIEQSLRITTAIHLQAMLRPLQEFELE